MAGATLSLTVPFLFQMDLSSTYHKKESLANTNSPNAMLQINTFLCLMTTLQGITFFGCALVTRSYLLILPLRT